MAKRVHPVVRYCRAHGLNQSQFARDVAGCSRAQVSRVVRELSRFSPRKAREIHRRTAGEVDFTDLMSWGL